MLADQANIGKNKWIQAMEQSQRANPIVMDAEKTF